MSVGQPDFMMPVFGAPPYWLGIYPNVETHGVAAIPQRMTYRDVQYRTLRDFMVSALVGYQIAGDYGITWREDRQGKSWFFLHKLTLSDADSQYATRTYYLGRLTLDGASWEVQYTRLIGASHTAADDVIVPAPFATNNGWHAHFAIGPDGHLWVPTISGVRPINPATGAFSASAIGYPVAISQYGGGGFTGGAGRDDRVWKLRGITGTRAALWIQVWFSAIMFQTRTPGDGWTYFDYRADDVRWRWYSIPWGGDIWTLRAEIAIPVDGVFRTAFRTHPVLPTEYPGYWLEGTDGTGQAPLSIWDDHYDIGGCDPRRDVVLGVRTRYFTAANIWERDYEVGAGGLSIRAQDPSFRRRRPVRVGSSTWVHAAPAQTGAVVHQRFPSITTTASDRTESLDVPRLTAPMSQWRVGKGPARI